MNKIIFNTKTRINQLRIRIQTAFKILFNPKKSWVILYMDHSDIVKQLSGEEYDVPMTYHRMQLYGVYTTIKNVADSISETDYILMKAEFQAQSELYQKGEL